RESEVTVPEVTGSPATSTTRPHSAARTGVRAKVRAYLALTKPRIIELLLITTVPTMILAAEGFPSWWLIAVTLVCGAIAAEWANTWNMFYDRDIDVVMNRSRKRPLVHGEINTRAVLVLGSVLGLFSEAWLWLTVNWLAA